MVPRGCPQHSLTGLLWLQAAGSRGWPRWAGDGGGGLRGTSPGAGQGPGAGGAQGCRPRSLHSAGPMLLPGAGIYMVRGGGSCRDKQSGDEGQVPEASGDRCSERYPGATHRCTHPTPNKTHYTYTHPDADVHIKPHRAPAHAVNPTVLMPTGRSMQSLPGSA